MINLLQLVQECRLDELTNLESAPDEIKAENLYWKCEILLQGL